MEVEMKEREEELLATERDWTAIPSSLLRLIASKLPDFLDSIHFNATCKAWNLLVPLSEATPRHPWLFDSFNSLNSSFNFYSFTSNTAISITASKFNLDCMRHVYTTSLGYLLSYQCGTASYSLIDPLIGTETDLPPFEPFIKLPLHPPRVLRAQDGFVLSIISYTLRFGYKYQLALHWFKNSENSSKWTSVLWFSNNRHAAYEFYDEKYFINDDFDATYVINANSTGEFLYKVKNPIFDYVIRPLNNEKLFQKCIYLVESSGELLKILMIAYGRGNKPMLCRYLFFVYRLMNEDINSHWFKMEGIGDRAIFLNKFDGFSLRSNEYPILRKNSIYFMKSMTKGVNGDNADANQFNNHHRVIVACRYDLGTGIVEDFPYIMKDWGSWFLP